MTTRTVGALGTPWTHFWDMLSGGGQKLDWGHIFIEAPEDEAKVIFYNRFGRNPERVTCTCCGEDYSISEGVSLRLLTAYQRNCRSLETPKDERGLYMTVDEAHGFTPEQVAYFKEHYYLENGEEPQLGFQVSSFGRFGSYQTLEQYLASGVAKVITAAEIKPEERHGDIPAEGYVWAGD